jgi:carbon monoxide dehydrogenase subunit G
MRVELEHVVPASPAAVFAVLSDPTRRPEWQEGTSAVALLDPPPIGLGSRWTEHQRGVGDVEAEVTGFASGERWAEAGATAAGTAEVDVTLHPDPAGTRLAVHLELRLRGARKLAEIALGPIARSRMEADLVRLAALLERTPTG